ncbi:MAG: multiheme c-type cytochrome [Gemmatimonadota bacterium]
MGARWAPILVLAAGLAGPLAAAPVAEVTLVYSGSTDGAIWPCSGCAGEPAGGLARRAAAVRRLRQEHADLLLVDSGDVLSARGAPVGDRAVLQVYRQLGYDAVNLGDQELVNGVEFFRQEVLGAGLSLVSASLWDNASAQVLVPPFAVRQVAGVRVGLIGLVDLQSFMALPPGRYRGIRVASLAEALDEVLPALRPQVDLLVVLANLGREGDRDLAEETRGIDVIIGSHSGEATSQPETVGRTLIVRPGFGGENLGVLELRVGPGPVILGYAHRLIRLDESVPEDPAAVELVRGVAAIEAGSQKEMMPSLQTGRLYTESERCGACHPEAMEAWSRHGHARAYDTLPLERRGNLGCLPCHASGWAKGGFIDEERTPELRHVGCTACHQVRRKHLSWPARSPVPEVLAVDCLRCHTAEWTPDFEFGTYWPRIAH